jgi:hypothetical protein
MRRKGVSYFGAAAVPTSCNTGPILKNYNKKYKLSDGAAIDFFDGHKITDFILKFDFVCALLF